MCYIYSEILLNHRKEVMPFAITRMKLEGIILSEVSQTEKDKYCVISLICEIKKPQTHKNGEQIGDYQRQRVGGKVLRYSKGGSMVKNPPANAGDAGEVGSIPGSRRFL